MLLLCSGAVAWAADPSSETFPTKGGGPVQAVLDEAVASLGLQKAVKDGRLAVALVRMDGSGEDPWGFDGLGLLGGHRMFYAASLPKIAILYGAAVSLDQGRFELDQYLHDDLVAMIRNSCNPCATRVLALVGREWLLDLLAEGRYQFYDPAMGGGLWVGKDYAKRQAHHREPLKGLSHAATTWQAARFYWLLLNGELVSPERTELMLEALSKPAIPHKFVAGLKGRDIQEMYRKSGTWKRYHADSVVVVTENDAYILVALAQDPNGDNWLRRLAPAVHDRLIPNP